MTDASARVLPVSRRKPDLADEANAAQTKDFSALPLAQNGASEGARQSASEASLATVRPGLGEPLSIYEVARLLGCSAWTVRQRYLPQGLPHLQAYAGGRIVFFDEQVVAWILKRQQQKGGLKK